MGAKQCHCGRGSADAHDTEADSPVQAIVDATSIFRAVGPRDFQPAASSTALPQRVAEVEGPNPAEVETSESEELRRKASAAEESQTPGIPAEPERVEVLQEQQQDNPQDAAAFEAPDVVEKAGTINQGSPAARDAKEAPAEASESERKQRRSSSSGTTRRSRQQKAETKAVTAASGGGREECPGTKLVAAVEKKKPLTPLQKVQKRQEEEDRKAKEMSQTVDDILAGKYKDEPKKKPQQSAEELRIRLPTKYERDMTRNMILEGFRSEYRRIGEARNAASANLVNDQAISSYSQQEAEGLSIKDGHRSMPRPKKVSLPKDFRKFIGLISLKTLKKYSCTSNRKLLSVYGEVFDVSDRPDKYGENGPYSWMTGNDISWGFVSGKDTPEEINKFYDMWKIAPQATQNRKLTGLLAWVAFYEYEYGGSVGKLEEYSNEPGLKGPPMEECEECSIM